VVERKIEERIYVTGRRGGGGKQLLDDLKETREYWQMKEGTLDRTLWRTCLRRGYGPDVRQNTERINILNYLLHKNIKIEIQRIIILPVALCGCETWSLTMSEKRRLRECENRLLRKISEPKRDDVAEKWRKLHNEELNNLYPSPNITRMIK
jgi:hypothetical protein